MAANWAAASACIPGITWAYCFSVNAGDSWPRRADHVEQQDPSTTRARATGRLAIGVPYLMLDLHIGPASAWAIGIKNYLPGDAIKILIAAGLLPTCWRLVGYRSLAHRRRR